jgi:RNA polymerase sigma-70 factor (ECF subfamily)
MLSWFRKKKRRSASDYTNEEWLEALSEPPNEEALAALRSYLVRGLKVMLSKRVDAGVEAMAQDHAQDALLKILDNLETFRGESKFTTWAHKIAIREALTELRRKRWDNVSIEDLMPDDDPGDFVPDTLSDPGQSPESDTAEQLMIEEIHEMIQTVLTERQREAMMAVMIRGVPLEIVAREMDSNRNAMYKLLYDARQKMKAEFERRGISPEDLLSDL